MKVVYGCSIPPGLSAPTRGEVKVRIERLHLQDELVQEQQHIATHAAHQIAVHGDPMIPVDHCAVCPVFWGESSNFVYCVPSTDAHVDRGSQLCIFPVKTLEPQLQSYFQHMHASPLQGLVLRVTVPPQFSGKKQHIPVGHAVIDVSSLTSSSSIQGWFQVVHHLTGGCIGRVRVCIQLVMFAAADRDSRGGAKPVETLPFTRTSEAPVLPLATNDPPAGLGSGNSAAVTLQSENMLASQQATSSTAGPQVVETTAKQPLAADRPSVDSSAAAQRQIPDATQVHSKLRDWFQRGVDLRNKMSAAASATPGAALSSIGSSETLLSRMPLEGMHGVVPPMRVAEMSGAEHLHHHGVYNSSSDDEDDEEDDATTVSSSSEDDEHRTSYPSQRHGQTTTNTLPAAASQPLPSLHAPSVTIPFHGSLHLDISHLVFMNVASITDVAEVRIGFRLSQDVATAGKKASGALSSYVHVLPLAPGHRIQLKTNIEGSYTSNSKIVLELIHVVSQPAPLEDPHPTTVDSNGVQKFDLALIMAQKRMSEAVRRVVARESVLGIAVLDLCAAVTGRVAVFRDPLTGECPGRCTVDMLLDSRSLVADSVAASSEVRFDQADYQDIVGGIPRAVRHRAGEDIDTIGDRNHLNTSDHRSAKELDTSTASDAASSALSSNEDSSSSSEKDSISNKKHASPHVVIYPSTPGVSGGYKTTITIAQEQQEPVATVFPQHPHNDLSCIPPTLTPSAHAVRLHVSILEAKGLPCFSLSKSLQPETQDQTFGSLCVAIEDLFAPRKHFLSARPDTSSIGPSALPVLHSPWFVEAAVRGVGARSLCLGENNGAPRFLYECILNVPCSETPSEATHESLAATLSLRKCAVNTVAAIDVALVFSSTQVEEAPRHAHHSSSSISQCETQEVEFWSRCAVVGHARIDLSPLRHLNTVDGWFRVVSTHHAVETCIGYLRVAVRTL